MLGGTVLPINYGYSEVELQHVLQLTKPIALFASEQPLQKIVAIRNVLPSVKLLVSLGKQRPSRGIALLEDFFDNSPPGSLHSFTPQPVPLKQQVAVMVMSSGTTGLPKAVQLTHHNVMTVMAYQAEDPRYTELPGPSWRVF